MPSADNQTIALTTTGISTAGAVLAASPALLAAIGIGSAAIPFIGPIVAGLALGIGYLLRDPNGPLKVATTHIVDSIEPYLKQNLQAAYDQRDQNGGWLTQSEQDVLLSVFNTMWGKVVENCNNPQFKEPGQNCISDRQRGGKWDWFSYYYDPIKKIPVKPDGVQSLTANLLSGGGNSSLFVYGVLAIGALVILSIGKGE